MTRSRQLCDHPSAFFISSGPSAACTLFPYTSLFRSRLIERAFRLADVGVDHTHLRFGVLRGGGEGRRSAGGYGRRSEEHTSELQSRLHIVCRLLLEKKKTIIMMTSQAHSSRDLHNNG